MTTVVDAILSDVWEQFMQARMKIMAICGIAGVGKTTFLKHVCNHLAIPHHFDPVIWVTVSRNLSLEKVQDDIWKSIGVFDANWVDKSFDEKSKSLARVLRRKKFALALDDLSEQIDLNQLGVPIPQEHHEWKVIFTTRSPQLCFQMKSQLTVIMNKLRPAHAWDLFKNKIGENLLVDEKFIHLAKLIANECRGLPLLLCAVARAIACRTTFQEWKDAFKQILSFKQKNDVFSGQLVFDLLNFCFDSLPNCMTKSCIFYYSSFPEDYTILKNELIDFWICEKLLGHHQDALSLGYTTLDTLVRACLLEEEEGYVKLLDLIRDAALQTALQSRMFNNARLVEATDARDLETVGWIIPMRNSIRNLASVPHNLFTFLLKHNPFIMIKGEISQFMDALTVLVLSHSGLEKVPREVSKLVSLQYLNLSYTWIDSLPVELRMLKKLKCLNLEHDCELRVIPKQLISSLSSLQVLKMFRCGFSVEESVDNILCVRNMDIESLLCLDHLEVLSITITCTQALRKLFRNSKLTNCTQSLSLEVFWGTESLDISPFLAMKNLLKLEIHQAEKLRELNVNTVSEFLTETKFERLEEVTIGSCSKLQELTWVGLAPNLVVLRVKNCEEMKEIVGTEELGDFSMGPFPKLKFLELESLPELRSIYWKALPFQCLEKIKIVDCSLLRELPLNFDSAKENKMVIEAGEKWWKDIEWEDDATETRFQSFFRSLKLM